MNATQALRLVHWWFGLWEGVIPSLYRVVATGLAAVITAVILVLMGVHPLLAPPLALVAWIALAVLQEHDQRVQLPPDAAFVDALAAAVGEPPLNLVVEHAWGPHRARPEPFDTAVHLAPRNRTGHRLATMYIAMERDAARQLLYLDVSDDAPGPFTPIYQRLHERGCSNLAERITRAVSPEADARAIAEALLTAYW